VGAGDLSLIILIDHGSHAVLLTIERLQFGWLTRVVDPWVGEVLTPENMQKGAKYVLTPENVTFFH